MSNLIKTCRKCRSEVLHQITFSEGKNKEKFNIGGLRKEQLIRFLLKTHLSISYYTQLTS